MDVVDPTSDLGVSQQSTASWLLLAYVKQDARYLVNKCEKCQKLATLIQQLVEPQCHVTAMSFLSVGHGYS
ncbi:UNVERIFIED_CONTAM: hypothetical protein Slati_2885500 [Sesamum latifolium]|uniref:Uncharacterized protein n=1 Tax=Sesamum latifolium TaxID=2727402 RepID=A0AAW2VCK2_9LAMI